MVAEREAQGSDSVVEMLPTPASCEQGSVAGGEEDRRLFVLQVFMVAASGCALPR